MSGQGDDKAEAALERALARGPRDVLDLLDALRKALPQQLATHEGNVHAVLHRLVKRDRILTGGRSPRGLTLYRLPEEDEPAGTPDAEPQGTTADTAQAAARIASVVRDTSHRSRVQADVAAHRQQLTDEKSLAKFGSPRGLRHLLQRIDRGRPAVCFAAGAGDALRRFLFHEGPWIAGAVVLFFVLKLFVMPIYYIPSESMLPNLRVGDRVAVFLPHVRGVPDRWRIVTYERRGVTYVKRLVGLPGEEIAIVHGDVFVDGKLLVKPDEVREALRTPVGAWDFRDGTPRGWGTPQEAHDERSWTWRSGGFPAHPPRGLGNSYVLRDGYVRVLGERGERGELALIVTRGPAGSTDVSSIEWTLEVGMRGIRLREERYRDGSSLGPATVLASRENPPGAGQIELRISYVDGVLRASCADWSWQAARAAPDAALGVRVAERGAGSRVLSIGLDRDVHYAHLGEVAVPQRGGSLRNPHQIRKDAVFCLGDNTTDSKDSRYREPGDIPVDDLIGPVAFRVWPPGRIGLVR